MEHYDIFISYSRHDKEAVFPFVEQINKALNLECWIDLEGIESGEQFENVIIKAIDECKVVLFMLSDSSLKSEWTKREVYYAEGEGKRIVPVLVKGDKLRGWFKFHFSNVDFIDIRSGEQKEKLIRNLKAWLDKRAKKTMRKATEEPQQHPEEQAKFQPTQCYSTETSPVLIFTSTLRKKESSRFRLIADVEIFNEHIQTLYKTTCDLYDLKEEREDDHDVLIIDKGNGCFDRIRANSIELNLSKSMVFPPETDVVPTEKDVKNLEKFFPQYKGGLKYIGKSGEDFILYGLKDKNTQKRDVITSKGVKLFELNYDFDIRFITPSGLLVIEKRESDDVAYYGIFDKHGKVLVPCCYGRHSYKDADHFQRCILHNNFEVLPGILTFDGGKTYRDVYDDYIYKNVEGNYGIRIKTDENSNLIDIVRLTDHRVIRDNVMIGDDARLKDLGDGWYCVKVLDRSANGFGIEELLLLYNNDNAFTLKKGESVFEYTPLDVTNEKKRLFIGDGRIVTAVNRSRSSRWDMSEIIIRDYCGNIVKTIPGGQIYLMYPYKFQKLLAFKNMENILVYYDLSGNEHEIPYNIKFSIDDFEASFVSETVILICCKRYSKYILIDISGQILLNNNEPIEPMSNKYLSFREKKKYGVIYNNGQVLLEAQYSGVGIIK